MEMTTLSFNKEELMHLERIFMDKDKEEALRVFLEVIKPKLRLKGSSTFALNKGTGIPRGWLGSRLFNYFSRKGGEFHGRDNH
jgi:hypothetical protein